MNIIKRYFAIFATLVVTAASMQAEDLVILHTNDTHSQIDPLDSGKGGIMRRKALIDSVRAVQPNVLLVDAGDAVQGTLFFTLYGGEAEMKAMNVLGYDICVLGNHDFDNGMEPLARNIGMSNSQWLTTNYDLGKSILDDKLKPYLIKEFDGVRVGFMGINLDPRGMIAEGNYDGVEYLDPYKAANATAWALKHNEKVDKVVAVTHIGYELGERPSDIALARQSEDIDVIIGGHSHSTVVPDGNAEYVINALGNPVLVVQTGSRGVNIGEVTIDLDNPAAPATEKLIPVDERLDGYYDAELAETLKPYRASVDSIMGLKVAASGVVLDSQRLQNLFADQLKQLGDNLAGGKKVDLAIINKGGIRRELPKGIITEGMIITTLPFNNHAEVLEIKGGDLMEAFDVMASRGGDAVSSEVRAVFDPETGRCVSITIAGSPIDPERTYRIATIDYLANGGDYMFPLTKGTVVAASENILYIDILNLLRSNKRKLKPSDKPRMTPVS